MTIITKTLTKGHFIFVFIALFLTIRICFFFFSIVFLVFKHIALINIFFKEIVHIHFIK